MSQQIWAVMMTQQPFATDQINSNADVAKSSNNDLSGHGLNRRTASSCGGIVWATRRMQGRPSARLRLFRENPRRALIGMLRGLAEATLANSLVPGRFGVSTLRPGSFSMSRAPRSNICTRASRPNQLLRRPTRPRSAITVSKSLTMRSSEKPRPRSALAPRQFAARDQLRLAPSHRPCATRS